MNDFKITLSKQQQHYLQRLLPKGYSFQLYKVRKNISNYPYKEFQKKYKKPQSIILSKKQSLLPDSIEVSEKSFRERSEPILFREQLKKIQEDLLFIVRKLRKHESSYPFRSPVDPRALQIPDYFDVVLEPIDLKSIEEKIRRDEYEHVGEFERDIYKMIMNSYKYNQKLSSTQKKTMQFEELFVQIMKEFHRGKRDQNGQEKSMVKEEMIDEYMQLEECIKGQEGFGNESNKGYESPINPFMAVTHSLTSLPKEKQAPKLLRILTQMAEQQRPRYSRKQIPKPKSVPQLSKAPEPQLIQSQRLQPLYIQPQVKKQQPQQQQPSQQFSLPIYQQAFSQQLQPSQQKELSSQQIKDQIKSYIENQTQNNRQLNFSQGYNEAALGCKIKNTDVQKQITSLLKRLSEFPLTRQKKFKPVSKLTNLEQNMTLTDKKKLFDKITKLDQNDIQYIVKILTKGKDISKLDQFQIDLDKADSKVLREVQNFIALRDQNIINTNGQTNGVIPVVVQPQPVSAEVIKVPKKVRKQEKKQEKIKLKKKMSRKNSNDDSFSLNPPLVKKKKSQKPSQKYLKVQQMSDLYVQEQVSANEPKSQSSSYHPQPLHMQHHGKTGVQGPHTAQKQQQKQKSVKQWLQKGGIEDRKFPSSPIKQRFTPSKNLTNYLATQQLHQYPNYEQKMYDIDQFLVSSRNFNEQPQEQIIPFSTLSLNLNNKGRNSSNSIEGLDFIYDNNFSIGNRDKDYPEEEIREYSMEENGKDQNDDDHFF